MSDGSFDFRRFKRESKDQTCSNFPILHFSATDISLLESPFSKYLTVVCGGPPRQHATRPIYSIHSYDRFNMVKYLPERGIVIAATQKDRAAVISLAQVPNGGLALRVNWMLSLASQEQHRERPFMPLLGLAVGPIQGFESNKMFLIYRIRPTNVTASLSITDSRTQVKLTRMRKYQPGEVPAQKNQVVTKVKKARQACLGYAFRSICEYARSSICRKPWDGQLALPAP